MPRRFYRLAPLILALLAGPGCHSAAFTRARAEDSPDAWRAFLLDHDSGAEASYARTRLEALGWKAALAEGTPRAFRQFVEDFPLSDHRDEAERRLAALRYEAAASADDPASWRGFLEDRPPADLARDVRRRLDDLEFQAAVTAKGPRPLELYLARFPEGPHAAEARRLLDDRVYSTAAAHGLIGLADYLSRFPQGTHREDALERGERIRIEALIEEERFDEADRRIRILPDAQQPAERQALAAARHRVEIADLDRLRVARTPGPEASKPAVAIASLENLEAEALALAPPDRAAVQQLAGQLDDTDPRQRWIAAAELGATGSIWAIDPLLGAASRSRFWKVRLVAAAALRDLFEALPPQVREAEAARRAIELRPRAASSELCDQLGLLEEGAGDTAAARKAFAEARRYDPGDLFAAEEDLALAARAGDGAAVLALARELSAGAERYAVDHLWQEGLPVVLADRQLCGLADLAADAARAARQAAPAASEEQRAISGHESRIAAMLADAERGARLQDAAFLGCASGFPPPRVAAAVARRLQALSVLSESAKGAPEPEVEAVRAVLEEVALHDGARQVQDAARAAAARL